MPYVDRTVFTTNDQSSGQVADPNKLESNDSHLADTIDSNYTEFVNYMNGVKVSKLGLVNVGDYGTTSADIQKAIDDANANNESIVYFPKGTYTCDDTLTLYSNLRYMGVEAVLDFSGRSSYSTFDDPLIEAKGTVTSEPTLTSDATKGTNVIDLDTTGLSEGDLIIITSDKQWTGDANPHEHGEMAIIKSVVSSTQIEITHNLYEDYTTANNAKVQLLSPVKNIVFEGITVKGKGADPDGVTFGDYGLKFVYGKDILVQNCRFNQVDQTAVDLVSVYNSQAINNQLYFDKSPSESVTQYGIKVSNASTYSTISRNKITNSKHAILTGFTYDLPGIQREIIISNNHVEGTWHSAFMTHNSTEHVYINDNVVSGCKYAFEPRVSYVHIEGNAVDHCEDGLLLTSKPNHIDLINNMFINVSDYAVNLNDSTLYSGFNPEYIVIKGNKFINANVTFDVRNTADLKRGWEFSDNELIGNNTSSVGAVTVYGRVKGKFQNNHITSNDGAGLYLLGVSYSVVSGNLVEDTRSASIQLEDATINSTTYAADWNHITINSTFHHDFATAIYDNSTGANNLIANNVDGGTGAIS